MPLPAGGGAWPPENLAPVFERLASYAAWWTGDPADLAKAYGGLGGYAYDSTSRDRIANHPSQYRGGVVGTVSRWWWGEPLNTNQRASKLHIPVAADIARTSAELLFAEPPKISVESQEDGTNATQDRLNELVDDGVHATFLEALEVAAGLGGVYLKVCWDTDVTDRPWLSAVHADAAVPEWRWGQLAAVTFWEELSRDDKIVIRHLERHEVAGGKGFILHAVYKGTPTDLGKSVDLGAFPETENFEPIVETGIPKLTAEYIPNMKPNRLWRSMPCAAPMGRSDYAGIEPEMDALDEAWSSWMRDLRLGKARLIASNQMMQSAGRGQGAQVDLERELWTGMDIIGKPGEAPLTEIQFEIRVEEHARTTEALYEQIVRGAGYSAQTFGLAGEVAITATEADAKERSSVTTRGRKIGYTRPAVASVLETLLMVDAVVFGSGVTPVKPDLDFGPYVGESIETLAQTAQLLSAAKAASTKTLVEMVHPDWDDKQVDKEVLLIKDEQAAAKPVQLQPGGAIDGKQASDPVQVEGAVAPVRGEQKAEGEVLPQEGRGDNGNSGTRNPAGKGRIPGPAKT
jgi:A118 family predicted phage portal protein